MGYRSRPLADLDSYGRNRSIISVLLGVVFLALVLQLANLTIFHEEKYREKALDNLFDEKRLSYPRGNIYDSHGEVLATNQKVYALTFTLYGLKESDARATLTSIFNLISKSDEERIRDILETRPRWTRHTIATNLSQEQVLPILERPDDFPGARAQERYERLYPHGTDMAHLVGYLGKIQPSEVDIYQRPRYLLDADVGRVGLEKQFENRLAGHPGRERLQRDARGKRLAEPDLLESSQAGENLYLTIDAGLQKRAMELLKSQKGSVVVIDVSDGALLILASRPTFDPVNPGSSVADGEEAGFLFRAIRGLYPPASTIKATGAAAVLEAGVSPSETVFCDGAFSPAGWGVTYRCAHHHGSVDLADAIMGSCNEYFYTMGYRLGFDPFARANTQFGFGRITGVDLPGEKAGQLASSPSPGPGETTNLVIGQGSMLSTPLQVARAYAAIANGGRLVTPHVVGSIGYTRGEEPIENHEEGVGISSVHLRMIGDAMWRVANDPGGTAYEAGFPRSWEVAGKTGTAERPGDRQDAWFAGFFPRSSPRYAFVVHIENADAGGGDVAAPIAKEIIGSIINGVATEEVALHSK